MRKTLRAYVVAGCILQFLVFHILQTVAKETTVWLARQGIRDVSPITNISLHMYPFLNAFTLGFWLFVIYAFIRNKSDSVFAHTLGVLLVSSLGVVVFQAFGVAIVFAGTILKIE